MEGHLSKPCFFCNKNFQSTAASHDNSVIHNLRLLIWLLFYYIMIVQSAIGTPRSLPHEKPCVKLKLLGSCDKDQCPHKHEGVIPVEK